MKNFFIRNMRKVIAVILSMFSAMDSDLDEFESSLNDVIEKEFLKTFGLMTKTTTITEDNNGNIIAQATSSDGTATTTLSKNGTTDTLTTVVVPTEGEYNYTKVTTISTNNGTTSVSTTYTRSAKS